MAAVAGKGGEKLQQVDLQTLSLPQLNQLKSECDQDLGVFYDSIQILNSTKLKFAESEQCLKRITLDLNGTELMVPVTSSMFVPGKLIDCEHVLIEVGTGFYIKHKVPNALDYFKRKVDFVGDQVQKIEGIAMEKAKVRKVIMEVLEMKMKDMNISSPKPTS